MSPASLFTIMASQSPIEEERMTCMVVGDGLVGKTCLLLRYARDVFPDGYVPGVFEQSNKVEVIEGHSVLVSLWDMHRPGNIKVGHKRF